MRSLIIFFVILTSAACDRFVSEDTELGRIVLGESVDGAVLGADTTDVFEHLGPPTSTIRISGSVHYEWTSGDHAGIEIYYDILPGGRIANASSILIKRPFDGMTEDGIGIRSKRGMVVNAIGEPTHIDRRADGSTNEHFYIPGGNQVRFVFRNEEVESILMAGRKP